MIQNLNLRLIKERFLNEVSYENLTGEISCTEQDIAFTSVTTFGIIFFYIAIFSGGLLMDTVGLWLVRFILSLAVATAGVCLAFVTSYQPLIWLVAGALGIQAACALLSTLPTGD